MFVALKLVVLTVVAASVLTVVEPVVVIFMVEAFTLNAEQFT